MHKIKLLLVATAACLLAACAGHINSSELNALHQGMSPAAVSQVISSSPSQNLSMAVHHQPIMVQVYGSGPGAEYLAYKHGQLFYWGSANKFASSNDALVRAVGRRVTSDLGMSENNHSSGY